MAATPTPTPHDDPFGSARTPATFASVGLGVLDDEYDDVGAFVRLCQDVGSKSILQSDRVPARELRKDYRTVREYVRQQYSAATGTTPPF